MIFVIAVAAYTLPGLSDSRVIYGYKMVFRTEY